MELDFSTDMQDVSHVNLLCAQKVTEAVGEYISKNYDIPHDRDNRIEAVWNGYLETYLTEKNAAMDTEYSRAAEPPVRCGESHMSGLTGATLL